MSRRHSAPNRTVAEGGPRVRMPRRAACLGALRLLAATVVVALVVGGCSDDPVSQEPPSEPTDVTVKVPVA